MARNLSSPSSYSALNHHRRATLSHRRRSLRRVPVPRRRRPPYRFRRPLPPCSSLSPAELTSESRSPSSAGPSTSPPSPSTRLSLPSSLSSRATLKSSSTARAQTVEVSCSALLHWTRLMGETQDLVWRRTTRTLWMRLGSRIARRSCWLVGSRDGSTSLERRSTRSSWQHRKSTRDVLELCEELFLFRGDLDDRE